MMGDAIVIDMFYPHPVEQVWAALTNADALAAWLMPNDFEPRLGHQFTFHATSAHGWSGVVRCEVVGLDTLRRVAFTWHSGPLNTLVTFTLEPTEGGTHLRLEHSGFEASGQVGLTIRDLLANGWNSSILRERLPAFLNKQAREVGSSSIKS